MLSTFLVKQKLLLLRKNVKYIIGHLGKFWKVGYSIKYIKENWAIIGYILNINEDKALST